MAIKFEELVANSTDEARFFLFHPQTFSDRLTFPANWTSEDWLMRLDFAQGKQVSWRVHSDGGYNFRFTKKPLTELESENVAFTESYRLKVDHGGLLFDGGFLVPSDCQELVDPSDHDNFWLAVENGNYKLSVHALDWTTGRDQVYLDRLPEHVPNYVIQLEKVEDLSNIPLPRTDGNAAPNVYISKEFHEENGSGEPSKELPATIDSVFPGFVTELYEESIAIPLSWWVEEIDDGDVIVDGQRLDVHDYITDQMLEKYPLVVTLPSPDSEVGLLRSFDYGDIDWLNETYLAFFAKDVRVSITNYSAGKPFGSVEAKSLLISEQQLEAEKKERTLFRDLLKQYFGSEQYQPSEYDTPGFFNTLRCEHLDENALLLLACDSTEMLYEEEFEESLKHLDREQKTTKLIEWLQAKLR